VELRLAPVVTAHHGADGAARVLEDQHRSLLAGVLLEEEGASILSLLERHRYEVADLQDPRSLPGPGPGVPRGPQGKGRAGDPHFRSRRRDLRHDAAQGFPLREPRVLPGRVDERGEVGVALRAQVAGMMEAVAPGQALEAP